MNDESDVLRALKILVSDDEEAAKHILYQKGISLWDFGKRVLAGERIDDLLIPMPKLICPFCQTETLEVRPNDYPGQSKYWRCSNCRSTVEDNRKEDKP